MKISPIDSAKCIVHAVSHETIKLSEIMCEMHVAHLLLYLTLSLVTAEHTNSSLVG